MPHLLLVGAGFSRNWGGWLSTEVFEYLLGCPEVAQSAQLRQLLWQHQTQGGFESALAELQRQYKLNPQSNHSALIALDAAIERMFGDMNRGLMSVDRFEFSSDAAKSIGRFLTRFDAIFTLNQDVLLEHHYMLPNNVNLLSERQPRWVGCHLPGMIRLRPADPRLTDSWSHSTWYPKSENEFEINEQSQPVFKLHGSSNWKYSDGRSMLIMGGEKVREVGLTPILNWYATKFEEHLCATGAKLMVIGYGFRDNHINDAIKYAVERGLKLFIFAPEGAEIAHRLNPTRAPGKMSMGTPLEAMIEQSLVGASRRPLGAVFSSDLVEFDKVMRFFA